MQRSATPKARAPCFSRPMPSHFCASLKPSPSLPTRFSAGNLHVVEGDMPGLFAHHGLVARHQRQPRRLHVDHETGDAAMGALGRIGHRHQLTEVGIAGAGDETLGAVDDVVIALAHGAGFHRRRIGARVRLGLHEAELFLAALIGSIKRFFCSSFKRVENRPDFRSENSLAARRQRHRARQLFPHQHLRQTAEPAAAVFFRHVEHPQAHLFGFLLQLLANVGLELHVLDRVHLDRNQLLVDKLAHGVFEHLKFFGQIEIHDSPPLRILDRSGH